MTKEERKSLLGAIALSVEELSGDLGIHPVDVLAGLILVMQETRPAWREMAREILEGRDGQS